MMISVSTSTRSRLCARRGAGVRRAARLCDTIKFLLESSHLDVGESRFLWLAPLDGSKIASTSLG